MSSTSPSYPLAVKAAVAEGYRDVAPGWRTWRQAFEIAGADVTRALLNASCPTPGMRVLDIACGAGEPAIAIGPLVAPGDVVAIDLVPEMLQSAAANAARAGCSNISFIEADAEALPFGSESFDLVTCRAAIMHFPDPMRALSEAHRVLRPGGRAVFTALGPAAETPALLATIGVLLRHVPRAPTPRPGPDIYRFGVAGELSALFDAAGFRDVHEEIFTADCPWPGTAEHFWGALPDHAWRLRELIQSLAPDVRDRVAAEAIAALRQHERNGTLHLTAPTVIAAGAR
jgi:ubiquinone/menaquinone biosynthesis C-methylase UbiE